jgi:hypothetical protein
VQCAAFRAEVAQLVEQSIRNRQVSGSSPDLGSIFRAGVKIPTLFFGTDGPGAQIQNRTRTPNQKEKSTSRTAPLRCALAKGCGTQNYLPITSLADGAPPARQRFTHTTAPNSSSKQTASAASQHATRRGKTWMSPWQFPPVQRQVSFKRTASVRSRRSLTQRERLYRHIPTTLLVN